MNGQLQFYIKHWFNLPISLSSLGGVASELVHDNAESSCPKLYTPPELARDNVAMLCMIGDGPGLIK
jgi:hypothetical protein